MLSAFVFQLAFGLKPMVHGAAVHPPFTLENLISACSDIITLKNLAVAVVIADTVAVAI